MSGIVIQGLNKHYGREHVLKTIDLEVEPGEFVVLLGPSGCGKSTLLSAIAGLDEITSGEIRIKGTDVARLDPSRRGIAMVFQSYALYPTMTVRKNMSFGLRVAGFGKAEIKRRVAWAAALLQLEHLLDRRPSELSGGQRQRVAIGRALVRKAEVYLFDEPLSNLDAKLRTETRLELKKLHQDLGCTILYVTHDQVEAMTLATRIAVINNGSVEQYGDPGSIYDRPASLFVASFVGSPAMNFLQGEIALVDGGAEVDIGGSRLPLDRYAFATPLEHGRKVVLGIRPEDVHIDPAPGLSAPIAATPQFLEPMGADTLGWFDAGPRRLSARLLPQRAREMAGQQGLCFDLGKLSLFDARTNLRL
ncbi:ABC transporter ATP-binding protein [Consotaella aegiceratis]|uniref:ABC transporter ATP-binding protein n=1 Tax=Consotaella aegiceratis TaxID=3097961 RepID=UPI002F41D379